MKTDLDSIPPFRPAPWCVNGHVHTIGRSLLGSSVKPPHRRIEIPTPDDDFLELDVNLRGESGRPAVALFHGLEGSTDRFYIAELMQELVRNRYPVVGVNFRSCGSKMNRQRRFYHSGETEDYKTVFSWIRQKLPGRAIAAVGFSLGANALLKSLGELGEKHPAEASVAVSVPYDLKLGSKVISRGFNRVYEYRFLRTLRRKLDEKRKRFPDLPEFRGSTLYEFDDQVTSKIHGFEDAEDYYESCSAKQFIDSVQQPALLIHSKQDPICPVRAMPLDIIRDNPHLNCILTEEGGHVGYWSLPQGWLNQTIMNFFGQTFDI